MNVNVGVHMGICVWALTVRKYDCMCVRVVHFRAHCMGEHVCVCYCSVLKSCLTTIPQTAALQASLSFTVSLCLFKLTDSIELVMSPNHLTLCRPLLLPSIFPSIRVFPIASALRIRWPKNWSFSFSISPSNKYSELISFRIDWLDLLSVQETLKSLLPHHNSKVSIPRCSAFFVSNSYIHT